MIIIVDTNIVFSAILSSHGKINDLLLNSTGTFEFFTPTFIIEELDKHHNKLKKISGLSNSEIAFLKRTLFRHIELIDPELIREENWNRAFNLVKNIDEKDTPFIALSYEINGQLWTGDKKLSTGLKKLGSNITLSTENLLEIRN